MGKHDASDLYLTVGYPPTMRAKSGFVQLGETPLDPSAMGDILSAVLTNRQKREFESELELNTSLEMGEHGRFRVNVMKQRQNDALVIRRIVSKIPNFSELHLPNILEKLSMEQRGLVLIAGMTGAGKSTTLAAMVDYRNSLATGHIITIEDPIEYFHKHKQSVITQREVGIDTESYATALKNTLRQRPDVIMLGEVRDREVMEQTLNAAETGHLCLSTIHASNAYQSIERIVNLFPEDHVNQVRLNLSLNLKAIISQRLLPDTSGGLVPALEVMLNQGFIRELILKGEISKIKDIMEQNNSLGMCTFDQSLLQLFAQGRITEDTAVTNSDKPSEMKMKVEQLKLSGKAQASSVASGLAGLDTSLISLKD
ncbi:MAG: PilT/PilU family type 4a pilus ATPase [Alphaproteobacteria bacterium]|nr:PilT/PilU family type 4a pilus ATPase [Alphaproteobacteria bacterium]